MPIDNKPTNRSADRSTIVILPWNDFYRAKERASSGRRGAKSGGWGRFFGASASRAAIAVGLLASSAIMPMGSSAALAACALQTGTTYTCSGSSTSDTLTGASLTVTADGTYKTNNPAALGKGLSLTIANAGTNLSIIQQAGSNIFGRGYGVDIVQNGTGTTTINLAGIVATAARTSSTDTSAQDGLHIQTGTAAGNVIVSQTATSSITGALYGMYIQNQGVGSIQITTAGKVEGTDNIGIYAANGLATGKDIIVTQSAGSINGDEVGIRTLNSGSGETIVTTSGTITSAYSGGRGIYAQNFSKTSTNVTVNQLAGSVSSSGFAGVTAYNNGSGFTLVNIAGDVSNSTFYGYGVEAYNSNAASTDLTVNQTKGNIYSGFTGIHAMNLGSGSSTVTVESSVVAKDGPAIQTTTPNGATINIAASAVVSSTYGVAIRDGAYATEATDSYGGNAIVNTAGKVTGDIVLGLGNDTVNLTAGTLTGSIYGDDRDDAKSSNGIIDHEGNDSFNWTGGALVGGFHGQDGSDTALVSAAGYDGSQMLDGGDDVSSADGMIDTVTFTGGNYSAPGANIINWENIIVDGGKLAISDGALVTGSDEGLGLKLINNATFNGGSKLALTGNMSIDAGSQFTTSGNGSGIFSISGLLENNGTVSLGDGKAGDSLTIAGNYVSNGGIVVLDAVLGDDNSATDKLIINGNATGASILAVNNINGGGGLTSEGIQVIQIAGSSDADFTLQSGYKVAGAYTYRLYKGNASGSDVKDWYLRSAATPVPPVKPTDPVTPVTPVDPEATKPDEVVVPEYHVGAPVYESYAQSLLGLNTINTLQQRVGNRYWSGAGNMMISQGADAVQPYAAADEAGNLIEGNGVWGRIEGQYNHIEPRTSLTGTNYNQNIFKLQAGIDGMLSENEHGKLIGGIYVHYLHGKTRTNSRSYADGEISTDGYGLGGTLTWYGENGFYLDGVAQATWYNSDLSTSALGAPALKNGNDGFGYVLSLESGKRIALNQAWSITPQAQLVWSSVDFDAFTDGFGSRVSLDRGNSLQGRLGLTLDHEQSWQDDKGMTSRRHVYGIVNLYNEFLDGTKVDVSGVSFAAKKDRVWGGIGLGGSYNWHNDKYSIYGEGIVNTSLKDFGDSYSVKGNVGFRIKF